MKHIRLYTITFFLLTLLAGCSQDSAYFENGGENGGGSTPTNPDETMGYLNLSDFQLSVADDLEELPTTGAPDGKSRAGGSTTEASGDYLVSVVNNKTSETVFEGTYAEFKTTYPSTMPLVPSSYTLRAQSANYSAIPAVDWNSPAFSGSKTFTILKNTTTNLSGANALVCTLGNIKTTVSLSANLDGLFKPDDANQKLRTTLSLGETAIDFGRAEKRAAYFKAVASSNKITVRLRGQYNKAADGETPVYTPVDWKQEIPNCKAGQWRNITITVLNADKGNVQFQLTIETWAYDQKIDVDIMTYYMATEETIPDEEVSDENSPVVTLDGKDITKVFNLNTSMFDFDINYCSNMITAIITPATGSTMTKLNAVFESDNAAFLAAIAAEGYADHTVALWPAATEGTLKNFVVMRQSGNDLLAKVTYAGMKGLYDFEGTHSIKFVAVDNQNRTSYTHLTIKVTHGSSSQTGPGIVWDGHDFETRYSNEGLTVVIDVTSATGITGFLVDIDSPEVLTPEELAGLSLASHMDLINPATEEMANQLKALKFPIRDQISGQKALVFDITTFMPMISALNRTGTCDFKLTVTDASGTNSKTIKLSVTAPTE